MSPSTLADIGILAIAYVLGSIPFGILMSWLFNLSDPRKTGSKSIGATNVLRSGNWAAAFLTLLLDALKGVLAVWLALHFDPPFAQLAGLVVVVGHVWPIWLGFRGGKGIATAFGVLLILSWPVATACLVTWLTVAIVSRYSSLSSIVSILLSTLYALFLDENQVVFLCFVLSILLIWTHRTNIGRLLTGRETKIGKSSPPGPSQEG
jgi:glycerol-3-phosphate acyltransferase PlsY